jgi:hypothetical protein
MEVNDLHAPTTLVPGGDFSAYSTGGWPQSREDFWSGEKSLALAGFRTPVCSAPSLGTMLTELSHLHKRRKE